MIPDLIDGLDPRPDDAQIMAVTIKAAEARPESRIALQIGILKASGSLYRVIASNHE